MFAIRRSLTREAKSTRDKSASQTATFLEHQTTLLRRIQRFRHEQGVHMPQVINIIQPENIPSASNHETRAPQSIDLYMPSDLSSSLRPVYCDTTLVQMETKIRLACATDALQDLRRQLHMKVCMNRLKIRNVTGQLGSTRAQGILKTIEGRVADAANSYRASRKAYKALVGSGDWELTLRELKDEHVVGLSERQMTEIERQEAEATRVRVRGRADIPVTSGESRRQPSWIWYKGARNENETEESATETDGEINDGMSWFRMAIPLHQHLIYS